MPRRLGELFVPPKRSDENVSARSSVSDNIIVLKPNEM
jgi:hypothetical protein